MEKADNITLEIAMETPFWRMIGATEPDRLIDVRMTYEDLMVLLDCYDNVRKFVEKGAGVGEA